MEIYTIDKPEQLQMLRRIADPVQDIDSNIAQLAQDMVHTMIKGNGIGLAGPQVGRLLRIFTIKPGNAEPLVFINPEIIATSEELSLYDEGCLSIPGQYGEVKRPAAVQIHAWNTKGRPFTMEVDQLMATVIQHELDHLNGVLFLDHLKKGKKNKILKHFSVKPADYPEIA
ncbi:MAG: peptide deformylase [Spirochaeta sp. LUC14_002_19_P3]|nr:MAG: peptide deformylase [Spirochaeta sp. LUC14_002_19_P3]